MRAGDRRASPSHSPRRAAQIVLAILAASASMASSGCGDRGTSRKVMGRVTVDGAALEEGTIHFAPLDGAGPTAGTTIRAGRYEVEMPLGRKRVMIEAFRSGGVKRKDSYPGMGDLASKVQYLPSRYNSESTLEKDIVADGEPVDFELQSK
jgi:hypothetical protein